MLTIASIRKRLPALPAELTSWLPGLLLLLPILGVWAVLREALPPSWVPGISDLDEAGTQVDDEDRKEERAFGRKGWEHGKQYREFDVIIVGGGTAGCVLAARLSETPETSVLLLEAGRAGTLQLFSRIPSGFGRLFRHPTAEYNYEYEPTPEVRGRRLFCPRARMLGGCSSINAQMCHACSPSDFDELASLGFKSFSYDNILPYFIKSQSHVPAQAWPHAPHPARGHSGPVKIGYSWLNELCGAFIDACAALGLKKRTDLNVDEDGQGTLGVSRTTTFIHEGSRVSSATAYLTPDVIKRSNLTVAVGATCTRILLSAGANPRAVGIEFTPLDKPWPSLSGDVPQRPSYRAMARKEVILAAGSIATPQILQVSGIGPRDVLEQAGVPCVVDLPGVGTNLKDHLAVGAAYVAKPGTSLQYMAHPLKGLPALIEWLRYKSGPLTTNVSESLAFLRATDPELAAKSGVPAAKVADLTSMGKGPDIEVICAALLFAKHGSLAPPVTPGVSDYYSIAPLLLRPKSSGTVKIVSRDVFVKPKLDARFLSDKDNHDVTLLVWGLKFCTQIAKTEPLASKLVGPFRTNHPDFPTFPDTDRYNDQELAEWVRNHAEVLYHPVGTVALGLDRDNGGCLDEDLKVHGVAGLRVCDASIFPEQLSGHPVAPLIAIAEMFAEKLAKEIRRK